MSRIVTIIASLFIMNLFSCSPVRHFRKVATDINVTQEKKAIITPWVILNFPQKFTKGDTIELLIVDTVEVHEVDTLFAISKPSENIGQLNDTIVLNRIKYIIKTITRTVTDTVESSATADYLRSQLATSSEKIAQLNEKVNGEKEKTNSAKSEKNKWLWLFIAACGIIAGGIISKLKGWL